MTSFSIILFETETHQPVEDFLESLNRPTRAKIDRIFRTIETYGLEIGMPLVKRIEKGIFEIRVRGQEEVRLLCCEQDGKIYVLHGLKKKQWKIPAKEIEVARKRLTTI